MQSQFSAENGNFISFIYPLPLYQHPFVLEPTYLLHFKIDVDSVPLYGRFMSSVGLLLQILILYKLMGLFNCHRQKKTQSASFLPEDFFLRVVGWHLQDDKLVEDNKERINRINSKTEIRISRKNSTQASSMLLPALVLL